MWGEKVKVTDRGGVGKEWPPGLERLARREGVRESLGVSLLLQHL